jgi:hypothetical protein
VVFQEKEMVLANSKLETRNSERDSLGGLMTAIPLPRSAFRVPRF